MDFIIRGDVSSNEISQELTEVSAARQEEKTQQQQLGAQKGDRSDAYCQKQPVQPSDPEEPHMDGSCANHYSHRQTLVLQFHQIVLQDRTQYADLLHCLNNTNFEELTTSKEAAEVASLVQYAVDCGFVNSVWQLAVDIVERHPYLQGAQYARLVREVKDDHRPAPPGAELLMSLDWLLCFLTSQPNDDFRSQLCTGPFLQRLLGGLRDMRNKLDDQEMNANKLGVAMHLDLLHNCLRHPNVCRLARESGAVDVIAPYAKLPVTRLREVAVLALCRIVSPTELDLLRTDRATLCHMVSQTVTSSQSLEVAMSLEEVLSGFSRLADNHANKLTMAECGELLDLLATVVNGDRHGDKEVGVEIVWKIASRGSAVPLIARHRALKEALKSVVNCNNEIVAGKARAVVSSMTGRYTEDGRLLLSELLTYVIPDAAITDDSKIQMLEALAQLAKDKDFAVQIVERGGVDLVGACLQGEGEGVRHQALLTLQQLSCCPLGHRAIKNQEGTIRVLKELKAKSVNEQLSELAGTLLNALTCQM